MAAKKKKKETPAEPLNELRERMWSVVSWEKCEAGGMTYAEAEAKIAELQERKVSGLCIISDEAAKRIAPR